uniref:Uncharacterized protein n=1 Tax=Denticeps clupeoides TaxID=299321 RepID=A0A8C3ZVI2_9TELE
SLAAMSHLGTLALLLVVALAAASSGGKGRRGGKLGVRGDFVAGKFSTKDKMRCAWRASGDDVYNLTLTCSKDGAARVTCAFTGRPGACAGYARNADAYWRQVERALKKREAPCREPRAPIRAGMCKRAPGNAHFRRAPDGAEDAKSTEGQGRKATRRTGTVTVAASTCTRTDHSQQAREKCGEAWASLCNMLFTLVQSTDC